MKYNVFLLFTLLIYANIDAGWTLLGLEEDTVLSMAIDKSGKVIAGTNSNGIKVYDGKNWFDISTTPLPVNDILIIGPTRFIVAIGSGSNSDGIYLADSIENSPYYELSNMPIYGLMFPQSLAKTENCDSIFMGGRNTIILGRLDSATGEYTDFIPIKTAPNPFGVEEPKCAAIHIFKDKGHRLYAGGYDESPEPGEGHLLWMFPHSDSLVINSTMNVTSLTDGFRDDMGELVIVGTKDSVIYYRNNRMSALIAELVNSPNNEPVNDMITRYYHAVMASLLCVAVESGVYAAAPLTTDWFKVDSIPAIPLCLAGLSVNDDGKILSLYAGTDGGVYKYDTSVVPIKLKQKKNSINGLIVRPYSRNSISVSFNLFHAENICIDIINCIGKKTVTLYKGFLNSGQHTIIWNSNTIRNNHITNGVYVLRLRMENKSIIKRLLFVR